MNGPSKREPSADMRTGAAQVHEVFVSLVDAGFTEAQALVIVANLLRGGGQS